MGSRFVRFGVPGRPLRAALLGLIALGSAFASGCAGGVRSGDRGAARPGKDATTGSIIGVVRDAASGDALSFATVNATRPEAQQVAAEQSATTDADGNFEIADLQPGMYRVRVYYSTVSRDWGDVEVTAGGRRELAIALGLDGDGTAPVAAKDGAPVNEAAPSRGTRGRIAGQVLDERSGELLEGAVVSATAPFLRDAQMAVTDADGRYRLAGLPVGTYTVSVFYRLIGYGEIEIQRTGVEVKGGQTTDVRLLLDTNYESD